METMIAETLGVDAGHVNVKAKTAERLGPLGTGEAIAVQAVALIEEMS
jgi:2-C-methyl-D-erythritol 2,4-cyclodiphosphate synthase